uniref:Uncharacterized protein n=1 Tax=Anopheles atroparvus TaxID=41427 RepID=A0A182IXB0_ANOAO
MLAAGRLIENNRQQDMTEHAMVNMKRCVDAFEYDKTEPPSSSGNASSPYNDGSPYSEMVLQPHPLFVLLRRPLPLLIALSRISASQVRLKPFQHLDNLKLPVQPGHIQRPPAGRVHLKHTAARRQQTLDALSVTSGRRQMQRTVAGAIGFGRISAALEKHRQCHALAARCRQKDRREKVRVHRVRLPPGGFPKNREVSDGGRRVKAIPAGHGQLCTRNEILIAPIAVEATRKVQQSRPGMESNY